jgi:ketosteroid isomerase-like protein
MRYLFFLAGWLASLATSAQSAETPEINQHVWKPFIETFNQYRSDDFLALHSRDLIRSARDSKRVLNWQQYLDETKTGEANDKKEGFKRTLELRFTERLHSTTQAIDVGIYKTVYTFSNGTTQAFYGRFHVALRKEKGRWKILVDTDSSENGTIGEKDFYQAKPME